MEKVTDEILSMLERYEGVRGYYFHSQYFLRRFENSHNEIFTRLLRSHRRLGNTKAGGKVSASYLMGIK